MLSLCVRMQRCAQSPPKCCRYCCSCRCRCCCSCCGCCSQGYRRSCRRRHSCSACPPAGPPPRRQRARARLPPWAPPGTWAPPASRSARQGGRRSRQHRRRSAPRWRCLPPRCRSAQLRSHHRQAALRRGRRAPPRRARATAATQDMAMRAAHLPAPQRTRARPAHDCCHGVLARERGWCKRWGCCFLTRAPAATVHYCSQAHVRRLHGWVGGPGAKPEPNYCGLLHNAWPLMW